MKKRFPLVAFFILLIAGSVNSQTYFGINLAGAEFAPSRIPGTYGSDYIYPGNTSLDYYQSKGFRLVRLPFLWERMQPTINTALDATELARLDNFISLAQAHGIKVLLDVHNYGRRRINGVEYAIGSSQLPSSAFSDLWTRLATHFKNDTTVWAYGLMNEPHDLAAWVDAAQDAIYAIRNVDVNHFILVPGTDWSSAKRWPQNNALMALIEDPSNKYMFEAHVYFDADQTGQYKGTYTQENAYANVGVDNVSPFINWCKTNKVKGFIGEYGIPGNDPLWNTVLDKFLSYLMTNCTGGTYWAGGPYWGSYKLSVEPAGSVEKPQMAILEKYLSCPVNIAAVSTPQELEAEVFPNPFNENLFARLPEGKYNVQFINASGVVCLELETQELSGNEILLESNSLLPGLYFLKIEGENARAVKKVVKK